MTRGLSFLGGILRTRLGRPIRPRFLTYCVTFRCNARCVMCGSWKTGPVEELTTSEVERISRRLPRLDGVRLTGGEPFLRDDLDEIAAIIQDAVRPLFLHIASNGFLTERILGFCERRPRSVPLHLLISLDGRKTRHDAIRGVPSAWDRTTRTLLEIAPRQRDLRVSVAVNQTILNDEGLEDYRWVRDFCARQGLRHQAVLAYDGSAIYSGDPDAARLFPPGPGASARGNFDQGRLAAWLNELEADLETLPLAVKLGKRYYAAGLRERLVERRETLRPPCAALGAHLRLVPDGGIPVCLFNATRVGSLKESSLESVWTGERARSARAWVHACRGCWAECEVIPSAVYSGDLFRRALADSRRMLGGCLRAAARRRVSGGRAGGGGAGREDDQVAG